MTTMPTQTLGYRTEHDISFRFSLLLFFRFDYFRHYVIAFDILTVMLLLLFIFVFWFVSCQLMSHIGFYIRDVLFLLWMNWPENT